MSEKEEEKIGMASGGISPDEVKILQALELLGIKPKLGAAEDVAKLISALGGSSEESKEHVTADPPSKYGSYHFPKLSMFYGEEGKGDANRKSFRYEIMSLIKDKLFKEEQILLGIRRACKGKAADNMRRLGHDVTLSEVLDKFDSDYGSIESRESIMRKFYGCQQGPKESVSSFAGRLEDLFEQAVMLKGVKKSDTAILKEVLYAGLNRDLKHLSIYHCDTIKNYDEFKKELRRLEASLAEKDESEEKVTCKVASNVESQSKEMNEIKELLTRLNERIDVLEKLKDYQRQEQGHSRGYGRGFRGQGRGQCRGRGQWQGGRGSAGQNNYLPQRPLGNQNFQPTCFECNQKGHKQDKCPNNVYATVTCYNCGKPGHKQWNCPN